MVEYKKKNEEEENKKILNNEEHQEQDIRFEKKEFTNTIEEELEKENSKVKYKEGFEDDE